MRAGRSVRTPRRIAGAGMAAVLLTAALAFAPSAAVAAEQPDPAQSREVYRFWSTTKFDNAHFYTVSTAEAQKIHNTDGNWTYEGTDFRVWPLANGGCVSGSLPVHRFWSSKFESHFFTTNAAEATKVRTTDRNWAYEGLAFCTAPASMKNTVPVHRFWSAKFNKHFYTADAAEAADLRAGDRNWSYEGVALYSPASGPASPPLTTGLSGTPITPNADIARILADTNKARADNGKPALVLNERLTEQAQAWSEKQAAAGRMSHDPNMVSQLPPGWKGAAENVAMGYAVEDVVFDGWMDSPGHRANILGDFTHIGIGYHRGYFTQVFAKY